MTAIQFINKSPEEFKSDLINELKDLLQPQKEEVLLSQKEVADFYKVTVQTIINWQKKGLINAYMIGGKVRYKQSELLNNLVKI